MAAVAETLGVLVVVEVEARLIAGIQGLKDPAYPIESVLCAHLGQYPVST
jgi:hypothetical protein